MRLQFFRLLVIGLILLGALPAPTAIAQDAGAAGEVIAEGLNGPMGVLVDPNGDVWVIDSGLGGEEPVEMINPETDQLITATVGLTSRIVKIDMADGSMTDVAAVTSLGGPGGASGGSRLALLDGELYATVSDWLATVEMDPPAGVATIVKIGADGEVTEIFQSWPFERDNNPDGRILHAHPYGILGGPDGMLWVAEAGGNNLQRIDPATGEAEVVAVFEPLPGVFPRPEYDNEMLTDPVPTGVAVKDGGVYVSLLSGAPFIPGNARVLSVAEDGTVSDYATGLTMLTDLRSGPDGELYATSFGLFTEQGPVPNSGSLIRIKEGDASEVVIPGLSFATSVDFDADGNAYVTVNGVGAPGSGQVLKFAGATGMTAMTVGEMMAAMAPPPAEVDASATMTETGTMTETMAMTETEAMAETEAMTETAAAGEAGAPDIVDTAVAAGNFTTLISAIQEKGLEEALRAEGPFTVFAPTNTAFEALPLKDRIALYSEEDALSQALLYHVAPGKIMSSDIVDGMTVETLQGGALTFGVSDGTITVNGAKINPADIEASNGVIHVIDQVLNPAAAMMEGGEMATDTEGGEMATDTEAAAAPEAAPEPAPEVAPEAAPETLPQTGGETDSTVPLVVALLVMAALGFTAFIARRRHAA